MVGIAVKAQLVERFMMAIVWQAVSSDPFLRFLQSAYRNVMTMTMSANAKAKEKQSRRK